MFNYFFKKIQKQPPDLQRHSPEAFWKKVFLKISQTSLENTFVGVFFLIKLQAFSLQVFYKEPQEYFF